MVQLWKELWPKARRRVSGLLAWPWRTVRRMTWDGIWFAVLAVATAGVALRVDRLGNIPLLFSLVLLSLWATSLLMGGLSLRRLTLARRCPERVHAREPFQVTLTLHNNARLPAGGVVISESLRPVKGVARRSASAQESQRLLPGGPGAGRVLGISGGETFATSVAGQGQERARYQLIVRNRGIYQFGRTRLSTVFPFGFWRSERAVREPGRLVVYPRLGEIDAALFQELEIALQRLRRSRPSREEHDFRGLREYRHGDNPKWIHWKSSARQARPLVKEFEEPQTKRVVLFVDTNLRQIFGTRRYNFFELALSFAATAVRELVLRGCEVTLVAQPPGSEPVWSTVSRERRNWDVAFELLASLEHDDARTLADVRPWLPREMLRNVYVVVLGLGSLRQHADLTWVRSQNNIVKIVDVRGEEFGRLFRRGAATREDLEDDLLLALGDDELEALAQEELALVD